MTLRDLSQLYWLRQELARDEERLAELEAQAFAAPSQALTGMPGSPNRGASPTERLAVAIASLRETLTARKVACMEERARLEAWIDAIPDSVTRQIYVLRFVDGLTWNAVADRIGGGNTEDSVKKTCYRYLDAVNRKEATPLEGCPTCPEEV